MTISDATDVKTGADASRADSQRPDLNRIVAAVRQDLAQHNCPPEFVRIACDSVEQAAANLARGAEARERKRIIRWLRTVADVYAARFRAGKGEETIYWSDQLKAFSHAAEAIARRRHVRPH